MSFGIAGVIGVRPGRRVRSVSPGSFESPLGVIGFFRGRWVHWGAPWRTSGLIWGRCVVCVAAWGRRVRSGSLGS